MPKSSSPANALTRKVGPLPVWAWAVMALVLVFLWQRSHSAAAAAPLGGDVPPQSSGQPQGDAGAGNAASNLPADMLDALTSGAFGNYNYVYSPTDSHDITSSVDYGTGNWSPTYPTPPGAGPSPPPSGLPLPPPSAPPPSAPPGGFNDIVHLPNPPYFPGGPTGHGPVIG